jgi:thiamine-monophosphate kinase
VTTIALGPGAEFDRIRGIARALGNRARDLGDDCALIPEESTVLALSTDLSIEGVHFRREWLSPEEIGWRAASAALSDLAAEGAAALGLLAAIAAPRDVPAADFEAVSRGIGDAVAAAGGLVLGGDLSTAPVWIVAITVVGRTERPVRRSGARPGDGLWVTGKVGGAGAAVTLWKAGAQPDPQSRTAFVHPVARIREGEWLARHRATAMMDLSDGLAGDAWHLAAASGVRLEIRLDDLPLEPGVAEAARRVGMAPGEFGAQGGEDYELLVALPPSFGPQDVRSFMAAHDLSLTRIGTAVEGSGVVMTLESREVALTGFDHFA